MSYDTLSTEERLAACALVRTRFRGRADLEREAQRDPVALARLECALGLADENAVRATEDAAIDEQLRDCTWHHRDRARELLAMSPAQRRWWAARQTDAQAVLCVSSVLTDAAWAPAANLRRERRAAREGDPLADRRPGNVAERIALRRAEEAYWDAPFRRATHGHETHIVLVERGREGVDSRVAFVSPSSVGLPNAYSRKGYKVAQSTHTIRVSTAILAIDRETLVGDASRGYLYLRPDLRVVQGRGTSLRHERQRGPRGGWS